jgi:indolepyruvate ferredoxin oxidoreductase alpha subunit
MIGLDADDPGKKTLMMGNEAIARGAIEAGVGVVTGYPGTPASEILDTLATLAKKHDIYVELGVNEKVAVEVAAGASFAGIPSLTVMKYNGLNVASDVVALLSPGNIGRGGLAMVVADDPGGISSDNEQDTRNIAKMLGIPVLEPSDPNEAKEMIKYLLRLSADTGCICQMRTVTRVAHARGTVTLSKINEKKYKAYFDEVYNPIIPTLTKYNPNPASLMHLISLERLKSIRGNFESAEFNSYEGPDKPDLLIVACGIGYIYAIEAVNLLKLGSKVGILKIGTVWPLPENLIKSYLIKVNKVLVVEEMDPFLERSLMETVSDLPTDAPRITFYGKRSGHIEPYGELRPDSVIKALSDIMEMDYRPRDIAYSQKASELLDKLIFERGGAFCPGCPHRASFWAIKNALRMDGQEGFVTGDIGCYQQALMGTGFFQIRTCQSMGSSVGVASGLGKLQQFGFSQPIIAVCGDSTFYHSAIPAVINAIYNQSVFTLVVLDNSATAMTGLQPNPGTGITIMGDPVKPLKIENLCRALDISVEVCDPFNIAETTNVLLKSIRNQNGLSVIIMRRECELVRNRREKRKPYRINIDTNKCIGNDCGCNRYCFTVFNCPGLIWDEQRGVAAIDEAVCSGCGVCVDICPQGAIFKEPL